MKEILKKIVTAMRLNKNLMQKSFLFTLTLFSTFCYAQHSSKFYTYQQSQSFKGIKFGTSFSEVTKKLKLQPSPPSFGHSFEIKNPEYLLYDVIKCNVGTASFTNSGKLYQINLTTAAAYPPYKEYNMIKERLIYLFGPSDSEYTYDPNEKFIQYLQVGWVGTNLSISVIVNRPTSGEKTTVSIRILHNDLNREATKEIINSGKEEKVPEI